MLIRTGKLTKEQEQEIGHAAAEAFMREEGSFPNSFTLKESETYFRALVSMCSRAKVLYAVSPEGEGYIAFWRRRHGPGWFLKLRFCLQLCEGIRLERMNAFLDKLKDWKDYEEQFRKEKDYVNVFMIFVRTEWQGKGYMKTLMAEPLRVAEEYGIPCILDTDSEKKEKQYMSLGMHTVKQGCLPDGTKMYTMAYFPEGS